MDTQMSWPDVERGDMNIRKHTVKNLTHLGFRFIVVISLISCSSRKEKLGSNTPINLITSWRFSPEVGPVATSGDPADSARSASLSYRARRETKREVSV